MDQDEIEALVKDVLARGQRHFKFTNWSETYSCQPALYFEPETTEEIREVWKFSTRLLTFQVLPAKGQYWSLSKTLDLAYVPSIYIKWRLSRSMYHVKDSNTVILPF